MGTSRSGRRPNIITQVVRDPDDRPVRPAKISRLERRFWDAAIETADHLRAADTALAMLACRLYRLVRTAERKCAAEPMDRAAIHALSTYGREWRAIVERLCLDPLGRVRAASRSSTRKPADVDELKRRFGITG